MVVSFVPGETPLGAGVPARVEIAGTAGR
jgi:hypothetical protein